LNLFFSANSGIISSPQQQELEWLWTWGVNIFEVFLQLVVQLVARDLRFAKICLQVEICFSAIRGVEI